MITLTVNDKKYEVEVDPEMPLLWVVREHLKLTGTKFGCGIEMCGACTMQLDGKAVRTCNLPVKDAEGKKVTTIEGLPEDHPVRTAWIEGDVPQCGYCQSGQIMEAASMLAETPKPTDADIDRTMSGNVCRCGTYQKIRRAIHRAADIMAEGGKS